MPSGYWKKLESVLALEVDPETAGRIREIVGQVVRDETQESDEQAGRATEIMMSGEFVREQIMLRAIASGACAAPRMRASPPEIDALCLALGGAAGTPSESHLACLLRRLAPDHPVLARLDALAREHDRESRADQVTARETRGAPRTSSLP